MFRESKNAFVFLMTLLQKKKKPKKSIFKYFKIYEKLLINPTNSFPYAIIYFFSKRIYMNKKCISFFNGTAAKTGIINNQKKSIFKYFKNL